MVEAKKREMIWHITLVHVEEPRVPYHCSLCHYRAVNYRALQRHCTSYGPHRDMVERNPDAKDFLVVSQTPHFINLGTDGKICDGLLKGSANDLDLEEIVIEETSKEFDFIDMGTQTNDTYVTNKELKAEINVMKGSHQVELNRFGDFIARREEELRRREEEVEQLRRKLKGSEDRVRVLERENRHKDVEIEILRRKLRHEGSKREDDDDDDEPRRKVRSIVKKLF